jgi:hypothetical protein
MSDTLYVTPAQVLAAKLAIELSEEAGQAPDEALKAIANARVEAPDQSAPHHGTSSVSQDLLELAARVQRIEHQVHEPDFEASEHERSQPSTPPKPPTGDESPRPGVRQPESPEPAPIKSEDPRIPNPWARRTREAAVKQPTEPGPAIDPPGEETTGLR